MTTMRTCLGVSGLALALLACHGPSREAPRGTPASAASAQPAGSSAAPLSASSEPGPARESSSPRGPLRFLVVGGGATPESTEVSLEQDVELAERTLTGPGAVLFAGGSGSKSVREIDPAPREDPVLVGLGALFSPRAGRTSRYREPRLHADRATIENVERRLGAALDEPSGPFLLYIAAHGDQGAKPRDNSVALWGGSLLTPSRVAELSEGKARPFRVVMTSCYSGGFAELAFAHADEKDGASRAPRCGLFAGPWDRQTSGCDANPDRRAQESYGIHFLSALTRKDRAGRPLPAGEVDFDGDGAVSLLEAHTRARIASVSLDVPTTTSERWLRSVESGRPAGLADFLAEDRAVTRELGKALGLEDEKSASNRSDELARRLDALDAEMNKAEDELDARSRELGARLLERWPVLDDPYHPEFSAMLARDRSAISELLRSSGEASARAEAEEHVDAIDRELDKLEVEEARVERLVRAYETLHAAAALSKRGGPALEQYRKLLACERGAP